MAVHNLLLLCKAGPNPELTYALRSWEANLIGTKTLTIVGDLPTGLKPDLFLKGNPLDYLSVQDKQENVFENYKVLTACSEVPEDLLLLNDDFFLMQKRKRVPLLARNRTLEELYLEVADRYYSATRFSRTLQATYDALKEAGVEVPLSFDLHKPMPFKKSLMGEVLERFPEPGFSRRSLYGNLYGGNLAKVERCEDSKYAAGLEPKGSDWISTDDKSFVALKFLFDSLWPAPSQWEVGV